MTTPASTTDLTFVSAPSRLLTLDGVLCAVMGVAMGAATGPVADLLGTASTGVVRAVGAALVLYAIVLIVGARSRWALPVLKAAGFANIGWMVGSLAVTALADLSSIGQILVVAQGLVVGALGVVQLRTARR